MTFHRQSIVAGPEFRRLVLGLTAALFLSVLIGCESRSDSATALSATASEHSYSIRGILRQLPNPDLAGVPLLIQHEAIPGFIDYRGESAGMDSMTMPFAVGDAVSLDDFSIGDKVLFELRVDWQARAAMLITSISKLPPETTLDIGPE